MPSFDPAQATAQYLATIPPDVLKKAVSYTQGGHWYLLGGAIVTLIASYLILKSGLLNRLSDRLQAKSPRPWLTAFVCTAAFLAADWLLELPWSWLSEWKRKTDYGLTRQPVMGWLGESVISMAISLVILSLFMMLIYALLRKAPRRWWLLGGGAAAIMMTILMVLGPVFIEPIFNTYKPAPPGPVRDTVVALAQRTGTPSDKLYIYNGSKQSEAYTANVAGLFSSARVAMSDTMFRQGVDLAEVRGVVGHEMGHYQLNHALWGALAMGVLTMAGFYLASLLFPLISRAFGSELSIDNPASLPVLISVLTLLGLLATPAQSSFTRMYESQADAYSLANAHEPDGLSRALLKTVNYRAPSPSWLEEVVFYDHPSVSRRIERAMEWKAKHPDLVGK